MFQKGDYIIYRNTGVCQVAEIGVPDSVPVADESALYYFLVPMRGSGTIYIPVNSPVFMRPIISKEQANELIASIPQLPIVQTQYKDQKALVEAYKTLMQTHDCTALLQLIISIYKKGIELKERGKTLGKIDMQYKKQAEEMLHEELSIVLDIAYADIPAYIKKQVEAIA